MGAQEYKIIFAGSMGAGKTTAISAISEIPPISTEVRNLDLQTYNKETTTIAMDYGELTLDGGDRLRLYGTPGQQRLNFMWPILARGAIGLIILIDNSTKDPLTELGLYLDSFSSLTAKTGVVIGISHTDHAPVPSLTKYYEFLAERHQVLPIFLVDPREKKQVLMLFDVLLTTIESNFKP